MLVSFFKIPKLPSSRPSQIQKVKRNQINSLHCLVPLLPSDNGGGAPERIAAPAIDFSSLNPSSTLLRQAPHLSLLPRSSKLSPPTAVRLAPGPTLGLTSRPARCPAAASPLQRASPCISLSMQRASPCSSLSPAAACRYASSSLLVLFVVVCLLQYYHFGQF